MKTMRKNDDVIDDDGNNLCEDNVNNGRDTQKPNGFTITQGAAESIIIIMIMIIIIGIAASTISAAAAAIIMTEVVAAEAFYQNARGYASSSYGAVEGKPLVDGNWFAWRVSLRQPNRGSFRN